MGGAGERGRGAHRALLALGVAAVLVAGCRGVVPVAGAPTSPPFMLSGRWFTDAAGRVVMLRGMNFVEKAAPFLPGAVGFDDDDAAFLAANGFDTVRLGVVLEGLMPAPGRIDRAYIDGLAGTVRTLGRHGIFVLLDFHQDGYGPVTHGNGFPPWATITDGLSNPVVPFPLYYVQNPALQRAFDNFWADRPGPDGVGLQEHYAAAMRAVAARFATAPNLVGYEAMNEPWPGTDWSRCATGCPDLEQRLLVPFYHRMAAAVRSVDRSHLLFVEPFVLFNFGGADTSLPAIGDARTALSTHVYALDAAGDRAVMDRSVAAADRGGSSVLATEWGATDDPAKLTRTADQFDSTLVPWLFWSYNENVVVDTHRAPTSDNVRPAVLDALTRPFPVATNGTPEHLAFDSATGRLDYTFRAVRPDGRRAARALDTVVTIPPRQYPDGYQVVATGADVVSRACAHQLVLRNRRGAVAVTVRITRAPTCRPAPRHPGPSSVP